MRKHLLWLIYICLWLYSCNSRNNVILDSSSINYPDNRKSKTDKVVIYEKTIMDPYRWLENINSNEVLDWAKSQNELSFRYLSSIRQREKLSSQIQNSLSLETVYKGSRDGRWYIIEKTEGATGRQFISLYENGADTPKVVLEPQVIGNSRQVHFGAYCISPDGELMVFSLRNINTSVERVYCLNLKSRKYVDSPIIVSPNTSLSWGPFGGFYYNKSFVSDNKISIANALFYHKAGTHPKEDIVVYYDDFNPEIHPTAYRTSDNRYLVVTAGNKEYTKLYYKKLIPEDGSNLEKLVEFIGYSASIVDNYKDDFYILTNFDAPNGRVLRISPNSIDVGLWEEVIPESDIIKDRVYSIGGKFYARGRKKGDAIITAFDSTGKKLNEFVFNGAGILDGLMGRPTYNDVLFSYRSLYQPSTVFKLTPKTNEIEPFILYQGDYDTSDYVTEKIYAKASDGAEIPIYLFYKKGVEFDGSNPAIIYSNGCWGRPLRYSFSSFRLPFLNAGGIFVSIHPRGGTELGDAWYDAGAGLNKHRSVSDLKTAIQHVFDIKVSSPGKIVAGSEDGGAAVLMGVVNQNPEWFKAVIAKNGLFDLINYERYINASSWRRDFGSVTDFVEFQNLVKLSPLHNLVENKSYPAFFLECDLTNKSVSPIHTLKMAATLQDKYGKNSPIIVRINQEATGNNKMQEVYEWADRWAFFMHHLDMKSRRINLNM